ncbi:glutathione synthetase [Streptomyces sp. NPDC002402]
MALAVPEPPAVTLPAHRTGTAAVIAPAGAGDLYVSALARHGWNCVAVTLPGAPNTPCPSTPYVRRFAHTGSNRRTAARLGTLGVDAVLAGSRHGAELADWLADRLRLPGNHVATSDVRADLGWTAAALLHAGITAPRGIRTSRLAAALNWAAANRIPDLVLKHADAGRPASGHLCHSTDDIRAAWHHLQGGSTVPRPLVLQEHLAGPHYRIHTISAPGVDGTTEHTITAIWSQVRTSSFQLWRADLMRREGLLARALTLYTGRALTALGVRYGPAQSQLTYIPDRGPALLSVRTDPHAGFAADALRRAAGIDAIRDTALMLASGRSVHPVTARRPHVTEIALMPDRDGALDPTLLTSLTTLPTIAATTPLIPGARVTSGTTAGRLLLVADDRRAINLDHQVIRAVEALGLYSGSAP